MQKTLIATAVALLMAAPAMAQTLDMMLPSLTWPDDGVTVSTKGCDAAATTVCTPQK